MTLKKIQLLVSVFKSSADAVEDWIVPISSGAALYQKEDCTVALRDDTGDNISEKNPQYCELTAQYWAWKNLDCDVCGLMHQRRYFDFSEQSVYTADCRKIPRAYRIVDRPTEETLQAVRCDYETVCRLTDQYKVIAAVRENIYQSVSDYYNANDRQDFDDLGLVRAIIKDQYPEYLASADQYLNGTDAYFCNMFIMQKPQFDRYSAWLFDILTEYEHRKPADLFYPREQGKIAERLFGIYMTYIQHCTNIRWAEIPRIHFANINGATPKNFSFNTKMYALCPPGSMRRGWVRKLTALHHRKK